MHADFPFDPRSREIDNHFHLQMVAANTTELVEFQERTFRAQQVAAAANIRALTELGSRQDVTNQILTDLAAGFDRMNANVENLLDATHSQTQVLEEGF